MMQNKERDDLLKISDAFNTNANPAENSPEVFESYNKLMELIGSLNEKVEKVIEQHEGQFLLAYQHHVRKINIELSEIRKKADENQKQMKQSNKLMFLERQITLFRDQSLKLYDRLQEKTHEAQIYKAKALDLQKTCYITQKQIREAMKSKKTLEAKLRDAEERIRDLEEQIMLKEDEINKFTAPPTQGNTKAISFKKYSMREKQEKKEKAAMTTKKSLLYQNLRRASMSAHKTSDNELKQWFLQCIRTVKKDVASRKNSVYQFDLQEIHSIDEFKMVDKLKLLEKFMENEKLLTWMYEKIFPTRTQEIRQYFSVKKIQNQQHNPLNGHQYQKLLDLQGERPSSNQMNSIVGEDREKFQIMLPKMKARKSQIRNKISVREGKLSLSHF